MRKIFPYFLLITIALIFTSCQRPMTMGEMESILFEILEAGVISDGQYTNPKAGIRFNLPSGDIYGSKISQLYTVQKTPENVHKASWSTMVKTYEIDTKNTNHLIGFGDDVLVFNFRIKYNDYPQNEAKRDTEAEYAKRMRDIRVRGYVSELREEYKNTYVVSDVLYDEIAGEYYYHNTEYNIVDNLHRDIYYITRGRFRYYFIFRSNSDKADMEMIEHVLSSIEFFEPRELEIDGE